jgi:hypothetical protein
MLGATLDFALNRGTDWLFMVSVVAAIGVGKKVTLQTG